MRKARQMIYGLEWVAQKFFIACEWNMLELILQQEPCDVLLDHPEAYFAGGPLKVPSQPIRDYIQVSIAPMTEVGIDIRNMGNITDWTCRIDGVVSDIPTNVDVINVGIEPDLVEFIYSGEVHTTIKFFIEELPTE